MPRFWGKHALMHEQIPCRSKAVRGNSSKTRRLSLYCKTSWFGQISPLCMVFTPRWGHCSLTFNGLFGRQNLVLGFGLNMVLDKQCRVRHASIISLIIFTLQTFSASNLKLTIYQMHLLGFLKYSLHIYVYFCPFSLSTRLWNIFNILVITAIKSIIFSLRTWIRNWF